MASFADFSAKQQHLLGSENAPNFPRNLIVIFVRG